MRIVAAMSGGVDSSVAAALLLEQGHEVIGVTLDMGLSSSSAAGDAGKVAGLLGIRHIVHDVSGVFSEKVITYFCDEYGSGRTPNPCVMCNKHVKFGELLRLARELGAAALATGHYARTGVDPATGRRLLLKARDPAKDQSYVLYTLGQDQLGAAVFPLGGMAKREVRAVAGRLGLPVAEKPESQETCFIAGDYRDFLERRCPAGARPGPIVDSAGNVLGTHRGLGFYTIGQRKGLGLAVGQPMYVIALDRENNTLVVGPSEETLSWGCIVNAINFIPFECLTKAMSVTCKIRYKAEETPATITPGPEDTVRVIFSSPRRAVAPGQSAVFYDGDSVVGGGVIQRGITSQGA